jgi:CxxC motif-containing protein (DUF1111 family)
MNAPGRAKALRYVRVVIGSIVLSVALVNSQAVQKPGDPLPGITPVEFTEFRLGLDDFTEVETAEEGLGPAFNATSCAVCHNVPAIGGGSLILETRAAYRDGSPLNEAGDTLVHLFSTPTHGCQPAVPNDATIVARRTAIPVFGAGLVEAIPDESILALEDPLDRNGDGVSGRAAIVRDVATGDRRVGRFGWKAQHATLLAFGADAYRNEMGITNDLFRDEFAFGVHGDLMRLCDPIPEPEDRRDLATGRRGIDNFESFMRFLAPIARGTVDQTAAAPLFSDLLLHDVATGDGIPQAAARPEEIRTPALWGLRLRRPLLHDGSAATIEDAIARHGNEAGLARQGFIQLSPDDRARLMAFLKSL